LYILCAIKGKWLSLIMFLRKFVRCVEMHSQSQRQCIGLRHCCDQQISLQEQCHFMSIFRMWWFWSGVGQGYSPKQRRYSNATVAFLHYNNVYY